MVHLDARKHCTRQGGQMVGCMRIGRTRGHNLKYWGMGSEARKMVPDRVKAKGGALRDRKTCLNLRLDNCQRPIFTSQCSQRPQNKHQNGKRRYAHRDQRHRTRATETLGEECNHEKDYPISSSQSLDFDNGNRVGRTPT